MWQFRIQSAFRQILIGKLQAALVLSFVFVLMSGCATKVHVVSYKTPEATFATWQHAASKLDLGLLLRSYANSARPVIEADLKRTTEEELKKMSEEARETSFSIEKVVFEENTAYLRVRRKMKKMQDIEVVTMIKEDNQWKLLP